MIVLDALLIVPKSLNKTDTIYFVVIWLYESTLRDQFIDTDKSVWNGFWTLYKTFNVVEHRKSSLKTLGEINGENVYESKNG